MKRITLAIILAVLTSGIVHAQDAADRIEFYVGATGIGALDSLEVSDDDDGRLVTTGVYAGGVGGVNFVRNGLLFGVEGRVTHGLWEEIDEDVEEFDGGSFFERFVDIDTLEEGISSEFAFRIGAVLGQAVIYGKAGAGGAVLRQTSFSESTFSSPFFGTDVSTSTSESQDFYGTALFGLGGEYDFRPFFIRAEGEFRHIFELESTQYRLGSVIGVKF